MDPEHEREHRGRHDRGHARPVPFRHETPAERADRNYSELVQELRVAQTGVQILFAFLLSLAFLPGFPDTTSFSVVLTGALLAAGGATICFIAPVAFHRGLFRRGAKEEIVGLTHRLAIAGLTLLAASMGLATWLVLARLWSAQSASAVVAAMLVVVVLVWVVLPRAVYRHTNHRGDV